MLWFIVLAGVFSVLTVIAFALDGVLDSFVPDIGGDGLLSSTSIFAAIAGGGYGGWIALGGLDVSMTVAGLVALLTAVVVLAVTAVALRAVRRAETPQARLEDTVGRPGTALTGAPEGRPFEFLVHHGGHPMKISAVADHDVSRGAELVVEHVISPTRLHVRSP